MSRLEISEYVSHKRKAKGRPQSITTTLDFPKQKQDRHWEPILMLKIEKVGLD